MAQRTKKNPLAHMERHLPNMDAFDANLWLAPWRDGWRADKVQSAAELPDWMSDAARQDIMATAQEDRENNARWWVNLWQEHPAPHDKELLFVAAAMAATLGWPHVVQNLIDRGAPLEMDKPEAGWRWMQNSRLHKLPKDHYALLELCAWAMQGDNSASHPLHPSRAQSLEVLVENGARVDGLHPKTCVMLMQQEHLAKWFIAHGLKADRPTAPDALLIDELFSQWPKIAPNVHGRILSCFIDHGLPVRFSEDGVSLPQRLAQTVAGLTQLHRLTVHPDREGVRLAVHEAMPAIEKRLKLRSATDQEAFQQTFEVMMLEIDTPKAQAMRARARL